jgi:hypothetical protein
MAPAQKQHKKIHEKGEPTWFTFSDAEPDQHT